MGVWIEIFRMCGYPLLWTSLPLWECGLKLLVVSVFVSRFSVTPLVGVWIEIERGLKYSTICTVTPLVGVWIEICQYLQYLKVDRSLPLWECGLKFFYERGDKSCV